MCGCSFVFISIFVLFYLFWTFFVVLSHRTNVIICASFSQSHLKTIWKFVTFCPCAHRSYPCQTTVAWSQYFLNFFFASSNFISSELFCRTQSPFRWFQIFFYNSNISFFIYICFYVLLFVLSIACNISYGFFIVSFVWVIISHSAST